MGARSVIPRTCRAGSVNHSTTTLTTSYQTIASTNYPDSATTAGPILVIVSYTLSVVISGANSTVSTQCLKGSTSLFGAGNVEDLKFTADQDMNVTRMYLDLFPTDNVTTLYAVQAKKDDGTCTIKDIHFMLLELRS